LQPRRRLLGIEGALDARMPGESLLDEGGVGEGLAVAAMQLGPNLFQRCAFVSVTRGIVGERLDGGRKPGCFLDLILEEERADEGRLSLPATNHLHRRIAATEIRWSRTQLTTVYSRATAERCIAAPPTSFVAIQSGRRLAGLQGALRGIGKPGRGKAARGFPRAWRAMRGGRRGNCRAPSPRAVGIVELNNR
jgi:hypothetical protein